MIEQVRSLAGCSSRGPRLYSQGLSWQLTASVTTVPGILTPSIGAHGHCTYKYAGKTLVYKKHINVYLFTFT